jgi:hypothetical protein
MQSGQEFAVFAFGTDCTTVKAQEKKAFCTDFVICTTSLITCQQGVKSQVTQRFNTPLPLVKVWGAIEIYLTDRILHTTHTIVVMVIKYAAET